jgi:hypothetical protein
VRSRQVGSGGQKLGKRSGPKLSHMTAPTLARAHGSHRALAARHNSGWPRAEGAC